MQIIGVYAKYKNKQPILLWLDLTLNHMIVGINGSGKTTVLDVLSGCKHNLCFYVKGDWIPSDSIYFQNSLSTSNKMSLLENIAYYKYVLIDEYSDNDVALVEVIHKAIHLNKRIIACSTTKSKLFIFSAVFLNKNMSLYAEKPLYIKTLFPRTLNEASDVVIDYKILSDLCLSAMPIQIIMPNFSNFVDKEKLKFPFYTNALSLGNAFTAAAVELLLSGYNVQVKQDFNFNLDKYRMNIIRKCGVVIMG